MEPSPDFFATPKGLKPYAQPLFGLYLQEKEQLQKLWREQEQKGRDAYEAVGSSEWETIASDAFWRVPEWDEDAEFIKFAWVAAEKTPCVYDNHPCVYVREMASIHRRLLRKTLIFHRLLMLPMFFETVLQSISSWSDAELVVAQEWYRRLNLQVETKCVGANAAETAKWCAQDSSGNWLYPGWVDIRTHENGDVLRAALRASYSSITTPSTKAVEIQRPTIAPTDVATSVPKLTTALDDVVAATTTESTTAPSDAVAATTAETTTAPSDAVAATVTTPSNAVFAVPGGPVVTGSLGLCEMWRRCSLLRFPVNEKNQGLMYWMGTRCGSGERNQSYVNPLLYDKVWIPAEFVDSPNPLSVIRGFLTRGSADLLMYASYQISFVVVLNSNYRMRPTHFSLMFKSGVYDKSVDVSVEFSASTKTNFDTRLRVDRTVFWTKLADSIGEKDVRLSKPTTVSTWPCLEQDTAFSAFRVSCKFASGDGEKSYYPQVGVCHFELYGDLYYMPTMNDI